MIDLAGLHGMTLNQAAEQAARAARVVEYYAGGLLAEFQDGEPVDLSRHIDTLYRLAVDVTLLTERAEAAAGAGQTI